MKRLFKKLMPIIVLLILCTTVLTCLLGCTSEYTDNLNKIFETEYFRCISYDDQHVTILSLTEEGRKQTEYLIIPKEINGMEVTTLGGRIKGGSSINRKQYWFSSSARKVFLEGKDYILEICRFSPETVIISQYYDSDCIKLLAEEEYTICSINNNEFKKYVPADIFYYNNYKTDDNDLYCLNCRNDNGQWENPPAPDREGYVFSGWYLEKGCINKWNGQYPSSQEETLDLYAKWNNN